MTIRCPHCGRDGRLPDQLSSSMQSLRCRKCGGRFATRAQFPVDVAPNFEPAPFGTLPTAQLADGLSRFESNAEFVADPHNDDDPPSTLTDLDDSNYELTVSLEGELDDSHFELPTVTVTDRTASDSPSANVHHPSDTEPLPPEPQYYNLIDEWSRICCLGVLGLGSLSLVVTGIYLVRALLEAQSITSSTIILIVAFVGTVVFVFITVTTTALNVLLVDMARNIRRLRIQAERSARNASE
jgi:hypothetical protein